MPWGWECRAKLIKQVPTKPTKPRGTISSASKCPGPNHYETPEIFCELQIYYILITIVFIFISIL